MTRTQRVIGIAFVCGAAFAAFGCSQGDSEGPRADLSPEQRKQAMINDIKNNKDMPQFAKDMALARIQNAPGVKK